MNSAEVDGNVKQMADNPPLMKDVFIYAPLPAYAPKATIARLKAGQLHLSTGLNDVLLKKVWFRLVECDLFAVMRS